MNLSKPGAIYEKQRGANILSVPAVNKQSTKVHNESWTIIKQASKRRKITQHRGANMQQEHLQSGNEQIGAKNQKETKEITIKRNQSIHQPTQLAQP
jgi:hypothetical protein